MCAGFSAGLEPPDLLSFLIACDYGLNFFNPTENIVPRIAGFH